MKHLLTLIFLPQMLFAQAEYSYLFIKIEGLTINDFLPWGWVCSDSARGDLNGDRIADIAFIIQSKDSFPTLHTNPLSLHTCPLSLHTLPLTLHTCVKYQRVSVKH